VHEEEEQQDHHEHAGEAQLLGDHREQEIGVRFRQVEELLDARAQSHAGPFAAPERDERVRELVALAVRVRPRIHEAEDALQPVGRRDDEDAERDREQSREAREDSPVEAAEKEDRHGDRGHHHQRAEVRLAQQQRGDQRHHREHRQEALLEVVHERGLAHRVVRRIEHDEELHQLRGLEPGDAERNPAPSAVHLAADAGDQHDHEERGAQHEEPRRRALPQPYRHAEERDSERDAHRHVNGMASEEIAGAKTGEALGFRHRDRRRVHHHEPDAGEQRRGPDERGIEGGFAARRVVEHQGPSRSAMARAASANTSPRCA
jgi:hypothetical protein